MGTSQLAPVNLFELGMHLVAAEIRKRVSSLSSVAQDQIDALAVLAVFNHGPEIFDSDDKEQSFGSLIAGHILAGRTIVARTTDDHGVIFEVDKVQITKETYACIDSISYVLHVLAELLTELGQRTVRLDSRSSLLIQGTVEQWSKYILSRGEVEKFEASTRL